MTRKLRLHIEKLSAKPPHMHLTQEVYDAAAARHREAAALLDVTSGWDGKDFAASIKTADILFASLGFPQDNLAEVAPNLKWIFVPSAGVEGFMPFDWLPDGVAFTNNSGTHYPRAVEYAAMSFLALNNKLPTVLTSQRNAQWNPVFSSEIAGKTALIFGFGQIGRAAAEAARRFGMRVIGVRRSGAAHELADEMHPMSALPALLPGADFLLIAAPSTPETRGAIGAAELDSMKPGAGIVNMGRSAVMNYDALCERLNSGHIGGAILDVFDTEPLPVESPIWTTPNLIVTPHNSTDDPVTYIPRSLDIFFRNVERFAAGEELLNLVDRTLGY